MGLPLEVNAQQTHKRIHMSPKVNVNAYCKRHANALKNTRTMGFIVRQVWGEKPIDIYVEIKKKKLVLQTIAIQGEVIICKLPYHILL